MREEWRDRWRVIIRTAQKLKTQNLGHLWEMLSVQATYFHWEQSQYRKTTCTNRYCSLRLCQRVWFAMMMSYFSISDSLSIIINLIWSSDLIWSDLTFSSLLQNVLTMSYLFVSHTRTHTQTVKTQTVNTSLDPLRLVRGPKHEKNSFLLFSVFPRCSSSEGLLFTVVEGFQCWCRLYFRLEPEKKQHTAMLKNTKKELIKMSSKQEWFCFSVFTITPRRAMCVSSMTVCLRSGLSVRCPIYKKNEGKRSKRWKAKWEQIGCRRIWSRICRWTMWSRSN